MLRYQEYRVERCVLEHLQKFRSVHEDLSGGCVVQVQMESIYVPSMHSTVVQHQERSHAIVDSVSSQSDPVFCVAVAVVVVEIVVEIVVEVEVVVVVVV